MTLTDEIKRLRELEAKATPGPWVKQTDAIVGKSNELVFDSGTFPHRIETYDLDFIAETRNALPGILDAAEKWERHVNAIQTQCWICPNCYDDHSSSKPCPLLAEAKEVLEFYASDHMMDNSKARALIEKLSSSKDSSERGKG